MPFRMFHDYFPEIAEQETRSITVLPQSNMGLPAGSYGFLEMFCGVGSGLAILHFVLIGYLHGETFTN